MPIRIEHQASPGIVGMAAYAAGSGGGVGVGRGGGRSSKYPISPYLANQRMQQGFEYRDKLADDQELRRQWSTPPSLTAIPDYVDPATRKELMQLGTGIRRLHTDFAHNDADARRRSQELTGQYEDRIAGLTPPSNAESVKRDLYYADEKTGEIFDEPAPGRNAYRKSTGKPAFDQTAAKADAAAAKQARAEADRAFQQSHSQWAQVEGLKQKHIDHLMKETDDLGNPIMSREDAEAAADEKYGKNPRPARPAADGGGAGRPVLGVGPDGLAVPVAPPGAETGATLPVTPAAPAAVISPQPAATGSAAPIAIPQGSKDVLDELFPRDNTGAAALSSDDRTAVTATGFPMATVDNSIGATSPTTSAERVQGRAAQKAAGRRARSDIVRSGSGGAGGRPVHRESVAPVARPAERGTAGFIAANVDRNPDADNSLPVNPLAFADLSGLSPDEVRRVRRLAESPAMREKLEKHYGGSIQTIDELNPIPQRPAVQPPRSALQEHVNAIRGPQGTGEGIASDSDRMVNSIAGVRNPYTRPDTGGTVTKYRLAGGIDEERFAAAERNLRAASQRTAAAKQKQAEVAAHESEVDRAFGFTPKAQSAAVNKAIAAARAGDVNAQRALDERGIRWKA